MIVNSELFEHLWGNISITVASCILPLLIGIAVCYVCGLTNALTKAARVCGILFESLSPAIMIVLMLYVFPWDKAADASFWACVIGFSICFAGYLPLRYKPSDALAKNIVVHSLGLASTVFKWSMCSRLVAAPGLLQYCFMEFNKNLDVSGLVIALILSFVIVLVLETAKYVAEEKM